MNGSSLHSEAVIAPAAVDIPSYLFQQGFRRGAFSDCRLVLHPSQRLLGSLHNGQQPPVFPVYNLHALLLARSPTLFACLARFGNHPPPYTLHLEWDDLHLTVEGLDVALGTLYSGIMQLPACATPTSPAEEGHTTANGTTTSNRATPSPGPAPFQNPAVNGLTTRDGSSLHVSVLAAAQLLGLHDLAQQAWQACTARWRTNEGVAEGIHYALSMGYGEQQQQQQQQHGNAPGSHAGAETPGAIDAPRDAGRLLLDDLLAQLVRGLPDPALEQVLVTLPFSLVKRALEDERLSLSSLERHNFARSVVQQRKLAGMWGQAGVEESVVVAFGGASRSGGIEILRRERGARKKQLWRAPQ